MIEKPVFNLGELQKVSQLWKIVREPKLERDKKIKVEATKMAEGIQLIAASSPEKLEGLTLFRVFQHKSGEGHGRHRRIEMDETLKSILTREEIVTDFESEEALYELGKILTGKKPSGKVTRYNDVYRRPYYPPKELVNSSGIWIEREFVQKDNLCDKTFNRYFFTSNPNL